MLSLTHNEKMEGVDETDPHGEGSASEGGDERLQRGGEGNVDGRKSGVWKREQNGRWE